MRLNRTGQLLLVSAASLAVAGLMSACGTLTVDFVYVTSAKAAGANNYGEVNVYEVNSESGRMRQIPTSPFPSGGRNPVAEAVSPDNVNLYVVNEDDNTIVQFIIGNDGKLYAQNTVNTPGVFPVAVTVGGSNLFVADTYQPLPTCSPSSPCSGSIAVFPMQAASSTIASGTLAPNTPINDCNGLDYLPLTVPGQAATEVITPTGINMPTTGSNLFVSAYDSTTKTGYLFGYLVGTLSCSGTSVPTLTALQGSPWILGHLGDGTQPSAVVQDPTGSYVYVADATGGQIFGFAVGSNTVTPLNGSPFPAGNKPAAIVIDTTGKYAYVANSLDSNVFAYTINNGSLIKSASYAVNTQPVAIGIDPSLNQYLYTANFLSNTVSGFQISPSDGSLLNSQGSPFPSNANPTAIAAIPHGHRAN